MPKPRILLLTHEREPSKPTNTGKLALDLLPNQVEQIIWSRVEPWPPLIDFLQSGRTALLYPSEDVMPLGECADAFDRFIILDATWQQARKMYNQSPYLKDAPKVVIDANHHSQYQLRRNQKVGGLCTIECIMELLITQGLVKEHDILETAFRQFNVKP